MAYYGDDFTGSTDVMESLTRGGVETVLFVRPPSETLLARYRHVRAVGIAGTSRAMSPSEMEAELPQAFRTLLDLHPPLVHYKTCSTFDSSPTVGNIGRAIEIGQKVVGNRVSPLIVGAPVLHRYCVFGNLFARSGLDSAAFRLDRHPTMKCHPVTPMDEADLRIHLARQTSLPVHLVDVLDLDSPDSSWQSLVEGHRGIVLFDTLHDQHLLQIGRAISRMQRQAEGPLFLAGSSGAEYALVEYWKEAGLVANDVRETPTGEPREQVLVASGSCSPVTERQIQWALGHGYVEARLDTTRLNDHGELANQVSKLVETATRELRHRRSVIVHTCRGPHDQRLEGSQATVAQLGQVLASVVRGVLQQIDISRVGVTGGDTSGHVARGLGIEALEMIGPLAPGSPLCRVRSRDPLVDGLEITFKGGQVGHDDFFGTLRAPSKK